MLRLDGVTKIYKVGAFGGRTMTAVDDVSFELRPGEVVSLIGESGSGKTTIGKMILGLRVVNAQGKHGGREIRAVVQRQPFLRFQAKALRRENRQLLAKHFQHLRCIV